MAKTHYVNEVERVFFCYGAEKDGNNQRRPQAMTYENKLRSI